MANASYLVASSVGTAIGADVARWTLVMGVAAGGYMVGGLLGGLSIANVFEFYLQLDRLAMEASPPSSASMQGATGTAPMVMERNWEGRAERRASLLILLMGLTGFAAVGMSLLKVPIVGNLTATLALWMGALTESLPYAGDLPWRLLWSHLLLVSLSTLLAVAAQLLIGRWLFKRQDPLSACLSAMPFLYMAVLPFYASMLTCAHLKSYWSDYGFGSEGISTPLLICIGGAVWVLVAVLVWLACRFVIVPRIKRRVFHLYPQQVLDYSGSVSMEEEYLAERGMVVRRISPLPINTPSLPSVVPAQSSSTNRSGSGKEATGSTGTNADHHFLSQFVIPAAPPSSSLSSTATLARLRAEEALKYFLLLLAGLAAATQAIFDVGMIYGILRVLAHDCQPALWWLVASGPFLLLLPCVMGIAGIFLLGLRPASIIGRDLVQMTPSSAVAVELGCFLPTLFCAILGYPISPLVAKLPAILAVSRIGNQPLLKRRLLLFMSLIIPFIAVAVPLATCMLLLFSR